MSKENVLKKMTYQGLFNAEKEKVPERTSRSKSRSVSKVSSISKSINQTQLSNRSWRKYSPKKNTKTEQSETVPGNTASSDSIFKEKKKKVEQDLMKKIIKLKNTTVKIDNNFKEQLATANKSLLQKSNMNESGRFEEMQIYL